MRFRSEREQQLAAEVVKQMTGLLLLDAVCMHYLALGEAVKQLDKVTDNTLQDQVPEQDWKGIMGFRDVLAHQYFNVDPRQVLWITREALPQLQVTLQIMLAALQHTDG